MLSRNRRKLCNPFISEIYFAFSNTRVYSIHLRFEQKAPGIKDVIFRNSHTKYTFIVFLSLVRGPTNLFFLEKTIPILTNFLNRNCFYLVITLLVNAKIVQINKYLKNANFIRASLAPRFSDFSNRLSVVKQAYFFSKFFIGTILIKHYTPARKVTLLNQY